MSENASEMFSELYHRTDPVSASRDVVKLSEQGIFDPAERLSERILFHRAIVALSDKIEELEARIRRLESIRASV